MSERKKKAAPDQVVEAALRRPRRAYSPPSFEVFELSAVVKGGGSGPFDIDNTAPGGPPQPP